MGESVKKILALVLGTLHLAAVTGVSLWLSAHAEAGNLLTSDGPDLALALGRVAGLWAASALLLQLLLIGRVRGLESVFGHDRLTRVHHVNGPVALVLVALHGAALVWCYAQQNDRGIVEQCAVFWAKWVGLPGALLAAAVMVFVVLFSMAPVRRRLPYQVWHTLHLAAYAVPALAFAHQFETGADFVASSAFRIYGWTVYGLVFGALAAGRIGLPLLRFARHRFVVEEVRPQAPGVTTIRIGGRGLSRWKARGGQFVMVRFLARGFWCEAHPFSLSAPPGGDALRLTVRTSGDFTARLPALAPGTRVIVEGPYGLFTAALARHDRVLLIAGGIGITPLRAMADDLIASGKSVILLHACRHTVDAVFGAEWNALAATGRLVRHVVVSDEPGAPGERGHIDAARLRRLVPDAAEREIFLCGPPPMMKAVLGALREIGAPASRIHFERFAL